MKIHHVKMENDQWSCTFFFPWKRWLFGVWYIPREFLTEAKGTRMLHWKYFQMWLILMFEVRIVTDAYEGSKQHLRKSVPVEWINLQFKITLEYDLFDRQRIWKTSPSMFNLLWIKNFELRNFLLSSTLKFDVFSTLNIDVVSTLKYDVSQSHMFQFWKSFWPMLGIRGHC